MGRGILNYIGEGELFFQELRSSQRCMIVTEEFNVALNLGFNLDETKL